MFQNMSNRTITTILILFLALSKSSSAQITPTAKCSVADFFRSITGEWVGVCVQSTNGQRASDKYFHVIISEVSPGVFDSKFEYYRPDDKTGNFLRIGQAALVTTAMPDGTAKCKISGKGIVQVNNQPKNQEHELFEVLSRAASGGLEGEGTGRISVFGMPLGLGKNGKVQKSSSAWVLGDGILTISQKITIGFRALFITREFDMEVKYTAYRGSDVANVISIPTQVSVKPERKT